MYNEIEMQELANNLHVSLMDLHFLNALQGLFCSVIVCFFLLKTLQY